MKKNRLIALVLAAGMAVSVCLTSCNSKDDNKNTSSGGVMSSAVSEGEDMMSKAESAGEDMISGLESGVESMLPGDNSDDTSKENSKDASNDASLDAPANAALTNIDFSALSSLSTEKHGWGQGTQVDEKNRPISCTQFQEQYGKYDAYFISQPQKTICLTFDEGYENGYTEKILDVLKEKDCPAVFFVTMPYVKSESELISRMIQEGHTVGNHTVNHPSMPEISVEKAASEILELHDYVKVQFQYEMTLFRPPMGEWSEQSLALTQQTGYQSVFWSFAYRDWVTDEQPDPAESLKKVVDSLHPGAIYLLHAVSSTNTAILGEFIDTARAQGYTFTTDLQH